MVKAKRVLYWYWLVGFAMGMFGLAAGVQAECRHAALDATHVLERKNLHSQYRSLCRRVEKGLRGEYR